MDWHKKIYGREKNTLLSPGMGGVIPKHTEMFISLFFNFQENFIFSNINMKAIKQETYLTKIVIITQEIT